MGAEKQGERRARIRCSSSELGQSDLHPPGWRDGEMERRRDGWRDGRIEGRRD